jgi:TPR repeat protein
MRRQPVSCISCLVVTAAAFATHAAPMAQAFAPPRYSRPDTSLTVAIAGTGIDIVRMPTQPPLAGAQPPVFTPVSPQTPAPPQPPPVAPAPAPAPPSPPSAVPIQPSQPLGRIVKLPVKIGSVPSARQKGWLGVSSDSFDLPLALSLGLRNANGALIVETTPGGPAGAAGVRFGDIIVGFNGSAIDTMQDLRQRVSATMPGTEAVLEIWRTTDDGDFLRTLRRLGEAGNAAVMHRLGRMYAAGIGVARDDAEAIRWFRMGAAAGNLNATTMLGVGLIEGRGTAKDTQEGVRLLKSAADRNGMDAMHRLGVILVNGKVVDKDIPEAVHLLTKASEAEHAPAMVDLAVMYNQGIGVQADPAKAAFWSKRAADLGNPTGMVNLGYLHEHGRGVEQSLTAAVTLYRRAADMGHALGFHNLAAMLDRGKGVERRDPEQAAELMLRSLELRNQFSYQMMAKNSNAFSPDFRRALQRRLRDAGVFDGRIDGAIKASTMAAIDAYIKRSQAQEGRLEQPW